MPSDDAIVFVLIGDGAAAHAAGLQRDGLTVLAAATAADGLAHLAVHEVALVMIDRALPERAALADELAGRQIPTVVVSGDPGDVVGGCFALARERQELRRALRANEQKVGTLGHDLRNPLGAIAMSAQLLEQLLTDPGQRRAVERITRAADRMTEMIAQLPAVPRARTTPTG